MFSVNVLNTSTIPGETAIRPAVCVGNWRLAAARLIQRTAAAAVFMAVTLAAGIAAPPPAAHPAPPLTDLPATFITLGTGGGPMIRAERSEPANAVVVGKSIYLFDVGNGVQRQMVLAHLPLMQVQAIFISHHHNDHNADLGAVIVNRWVMFARKPVPVIGPPGTVLMVRSITAGNFATERAPVTEGSPLPPPIASTVTARDMAADMNTPTLVYHDENIRVLAITNTHYHFPPGSEDQRFARSYSYRIETAHRIIVFTGDTGVSAHVAVLAKGADLLVSEVIDLAAMRKVLLLALLGPGPAAVIGLNAHDHEDHLTPTEVGELAQEAGVKEVVLTHLVPGLDGEKNLSGYTRGIDLHFKGPVYVARDCARW